MPTCPDGGAAGVSHGVARSNPTLYCHVNYSECDFDAILTGFFPGRKDGLKLCSL